MSKEHEEHIQNVKAMDNIIRRIGIEDILLTVTDELYQNDELEEIAKAVGKAADLLEKYKKENPGYDDKRVASPV